MSGVGGKFMAIICQSFVYIKFYHDNMKMEFHIIVPGFWKCMSQLIWSGVSHLVDFL